MLCTKHRRFVYRIDEHDKVLFGRQSCLIKGLRNVEVRRLLLSCLGFLEKLLEFRTVYNISPWVEHCQARQAVIRLDSGSEPRLHATLVQHILTPFAHPSPSKLQQIRYKAFDEIQHECQDYDREALRSTVTSADVSKQSRPKATFLNSARLVSKQVPPLDHHLCISHLLHLLDRHIWLSYVLPKPIFETIWRKTCFPVPPLLLEPNQPRST